MKNWIVNKFKKLWFWELAILMDENNITILSSWNNKVLMEPLYLAVKNEKIIAIGEDVKLSKYIQREDIEVIYPFSKGKIVHKEYASIMIKHFMDKVTRKFFFVQFRAIFTNQYQLSEKDEYDIRKLFIESGMHECHLLSRQTILMSDICLDKEFCSMHIIFDVQEYNTELYVLYKGGLVSKKSVNNSQIKEEFENFTKAIKLKQGLSLDEKSKLIICADLNQKREVVKVIEKLTTFETITEDSDKIMHQSLKKLLKHHE